MCRRWYISIVPPGHNPGTTRDIDFYSVACDDTTTLPPASNWFVLPIGQEVEPAPRVYPQFEFYI